WRFLSAKAPCDFNCFVDNHCFRRFPVVQELLCGQPQYVPVDDGHTIQTPMFRMPLNERINLLDMVDRPPHKLPSEIPYRRRFLVVFPKRHRDRLDVIAGDVPLKEHLKREFPSLASGTHCIRRSKSTISTAAIAAS